jgi:flagella basal body P-ring formation protein FlgA
MESSGVEVRATAKAMSDGASGEKIRVRNTSSKQVLEGVIVSAGVVRIER